MSEQKISHKIKYLKQIIQIKLDKVKNPNWPNEPRYLKAWHDLNSRLPWTNLASGQGESSWTRGLRIASPAF